MAVVNAIIGKPFSAAECAALATALGRLEALSRQLSNAGIKSSAKLKDAFDAAFADVRLADRADDIKEFRAVWAALAALGKLSDVEGVEGIQKACDMIVDGITAWENERAQIAKAAADAKAKSEAPVGAPAGAPAGAK